MEESLNTVIELIAKEKGISKDVLLYSVENAILAAAHKTFGEHRNLQAKYNPEKGSVDITQTITVVDHIEDADNESTQAECEANGIEVEPGDEMVFQMYYLDADKELAKEQDEAYGDILHIKTYNRSFGRIAAQAAKQVLTQGWRDAERDMIYSEYKERKGEMINGIIRRFERGNIIVDLGRTEAVLPVKEQCPRESYRAGDRIQAYVLDVLPAGRGHQIILSRATPELVVKLFEMEVPEIADGIVRIESVSREPGLRSKIAVSSYDRDVDPVGACVGMKGARVQSVVNELRGEKIDIVTWSDNIATFVCNSLAPAEVTRVLIDEARHAMEIIVPDDQLSLAIGRKGQNVRLAAQLTGWKLDVYSEAKIREIRDRAWASLSQITGLNDFMIQTLYNHGIRSAGDLADCSPSMLVEIPGMNPDTIHSVLEMAREVAEKERVQEEQAREEAKRLEEHIKIGRRLQDYHRMSEREKIMMIRGIGDRIADELAKEGYERVEQLAAAEDLEALAMIANIGIRKAKQFKYAAQQLMEEEANLTKEVEAAGITFVDGKMKIPGLNEEADEEAASANEE